MGNQPCLFVVVPVLNEQENVQKLLDAFRTVQNTYSKSFQISFLMVDDGSTDGTGATASELAAGLDLIVLSHKRNFGPGYAFGTAFEYMEGRIQGKDFVVTMEGDNTSRHELLDKMFRRLEEGYDVVLASPYMYGGGIVHTSPFRVFMSHIANAFVKEILGIHGILTMSSFYRVYRGSLVRKLQNTYGPRVLERQGFESMIELLMKMIYLKAAISEVPMVLDTSLRSGRSKMKIARTIAGYITLWKDKARWKRTAL